MTKIDLSFTTIKQELPDFIYEELANYSTQSNSYHYQPEILRTLVAQKHGIGINSVSLTAGADQAIMLLCSLYGQQGHIFTPTYISYTDIKKLGGDLSEHFSFQEDRYVIPTNLIEDASLIFLANPNNPAGITSREKILELVEANPKAKVVIDEAYGDFAGESVIGDVVSHQNLVVLRSFSKGYALAGFRIGYMVAQPAVLNAMILDSTWFNVAYTSVGAAVAAIKHEEYFAALRASINKEREQLTADLESWGYKTIPSYINGILLRCSDEREATALVERLKAHEIIVNLGNGASNVGLDKTYVRMGIGTTEQMAALRQAFKENDIAAGR